MSKPGPLLIFKIAPHADSYDRCRSKKIRCDGIRPCCSQCSSVGFECKTSDKLSRRAFPRGYTESLEERVRSLETEVRELKDLLDEKDEKIDMLSRLHSSSSSSSVPVFHSSPRRSSSSLSPDRSPGDKEETFRIQQSPFLEGHGALLHFTGTSSSKSFLRRHVVSLFQFQANFVTKMPLNKKSKRVDGPPQTSTQIVS